MRNGPPKKPVIILISLSLAALVVLSLPVIGEQASQAAANDVILCSSNVAGTQGNGGSDAMLAMSSDGRYIIFSSTATNLGATGHQVYRKDLKTGVVVLCSSNASGIQGNGASLFSSTSADGRYVAFSSTATNLTATPTSGTQQVFRKDLLSGEVLLVSSSKAGIQGNNVSYSTSMSSDGNYVAFISMATNLLVTPTSNTQIFRKNVQTGDVAICSTNASGGQGNDASLDPAISANGRYVGFYSKATNMMPGGNTSQQIFRKDLDTGDLKMCSSDASGTQGNAGSLRPSMSPDARYVAFESQATNLVPGSTAGQVFRKDLQTGAILLCSSDSTGTQGNGASDEPAISGDGRHVSFISWSSNLATGAFGLENVFRKDLETGAISIVSCDSNGAVPGSGSSMSPCISMDGRYTVFLSTATTLIPGGTNALGQVFRKELATPSTFYFAEGYTGNNFQEYLCLGTSTPAPSNVHITYLFSDGTSQEQSITVPGSSRVTINVNSMVGPGKDVSARLEGDAPFVAERPMYFNYKGEWTGGHDVVGAGMPATDWNFAEGYTGAGFEEWICVLNPGDVTAHLTFLFATEEEGAKEVDGYAVAPHSRASFSANQLLGGESYQTALTLESDSAIVAERPIYFNYSGTGGFGWKGGHCVMGRPYLSSQYYLAEGTTRSGFEEWLTLQNPSGQALTIQATYQLGPGQGDPVGKTYTVDAHKRLTKFVPDEVGREKDVSIYLVSSAPFLAERPMYFNYQGTAARNWQGGHCVMGASSTAFNWFFAEGFTGNNFEEWLCIQNPGATDAQVQFTYLTQEAGVLPLKIETIPAHSRQTFLVNTHAGAGYQLSVRLSVLSGPEIVVERPMYFYYNGWDGGHDVMGYVPIDV